jgi:hypothetical protein
VHRQKLSGDRKRRHSIISQYLSGMAETRAGASQVSPVGNDPLRQSTRMSDVSGFEFQAPRRVDQQLRAKLEAKLRRLDIYKGSSDFALEFGEGQGCAKSNQSNVPGLTRWCLSRTGPFIAENYPEAACSILLCPQPLVYHMQTLNAVINCRSHNQLCGSHCNSSTGSHLSSHHEKCCSTEK